MKKCINIIIAISLLVGMNTLSAQKFSSNVQLEVFDGAGRVSSGDKILFKSETDGTVVQTVTDADGKAEVRLLNGHRYQIKFNSFEEASNYTAVDIADADYEMEGLVLTLTYSLPKTYTLKNVNFASGSAVLTQSSYESLNNLAELLLLKESLKIELAGYTDNVGNPESNMQLSQKRAESVRNYLIKKGVPAERLQAKGYGQDFPVADNDTPEGRKENRRTEIHTIE